MKQILIFFYLTIIGIYSINAQKALKYYVASDIVSDQNLLEMFTIEEQIGYLRIELDYINNKLLKKLWDSLFLDPVYLTYISNDEWKLILKLKKHSKYNALIPRLWKMVFSSPNIMSKLTVKDIKHLINLRKKRHFLIKHIQILISLSQKKAIIQKEMQPISRGFGMRTRIDYKYFNYDYIKPGFSREYVNDKYIRMFDCRLSYNLEPGVEWELGIIGDYHSPLKQDNARNGRWASDISIGFISLMNKTSRLTIGKQDLDVNVFTHIKSLMGISLEKKDIWGIELAVLDHEGDFTRSKFRLKGLDDIIFINIIPPEFSLKGELFFFRNKGFDIKNIKSSLYAILWQNPYYSKQNIQWYSSNLLRKLLIGTRKFKYYGAHIEFSQSKNLMWIIDYSILDWYKSNDLPVDIKLDEAYSIGLKWDINSKNNLTILYDRVGDLFIVQNTYENSPYFYPYYEDIFLQNADFKHNFIRKGFVFNTRLTKKLSLNTVINSIKHFYLDDYITKTRNLLMGTLNYKINNDNNISLSITTTKSRLNSVLIPQNNIIFDDYHAINLSLNQKIF